MMNALDDAISREPSFIGEASRHLQAVLRTERALSQWFSKTDFVGEQGYRTKLAFRAIDESIARNGGCVADVGLFSRERIADCPSWQRELVVHHLSDGKGPNKYPDHNAHPSPYMSVSTSPEKIVKFIRTRVDQKEIAIIDMDMLRIVNVEYRQTTDLREEMRFRNDVDGQTFVSESHYLVLEHIPQCCILGFMSGREFTKLWDTKSRQIEQDPDHQGPEILHWKTDLRDHAQLKARSAFARNPQFAATALPLTQTRTPTTSSSNERVRPVPQAETPTRSYARVQRDPQSAAISQITPRTLNGRIQMTLYEMEDTTLNSAGAGSRRVRERSPERTISPGNVPEHDSARRRLW